MEQSELMREIESLGLELRNSREVLKKTQSEVSAPFFLSWPIRGEVRTMTEQNLCVQAQRWYRELGVSEVRREEAEKRAGKAANEVKGMREETKEVEKTKTENHTLRAEVWIEKVSLSLTTIVMS